MDAYSTNLSQPPGYTVRRATLDDLPQLTEFWNLERLPVAELEKRFTEFQVAEDPTGRIVAILGMRVVNKQGLLHGEVYSPAHLGPQIRPLLWNRILGLARNLGLLRVWTQDPDPFWLEQRFVNPVPLALDQLPPSFGGASPLWLCLTLRDESPEVLSIDQQLASYREEEKEKLNRLMASAKLFKTIAVIFVIVFLGGILTYAIINIIKARTLKGGGQMQQRGL